MRKTVYTLTFLTGFSGLVFQVAWQKYLSYFLGGEALSSALVVAIFLGGLAGGYALFGRLSAGRSPGDLLKLAGGAEIGIGVWVFLFPNIFEALWNHLDIFPATQPLRGIIDSLTAVLLLSPATILMGSTLPLLTRGLSELSSDLSRVHSRVYGINTMGAFLGSIAAGFFILQALGLPLTMISLSLFNLLAGAVILAYGSSLNDAAKPAAEPPAQVATGGPPTAAIALAFLTGFLSIGFEIVFMRSLSLAVGTSEYSYSLVVGIFVFMIAAGALSLRWKSVDVTRRLFRNQMAALAGLVLVYVTVPYWGWLAYVMRISLVSIPSNFYVYHFGVFLGFSIIISIPVFFMGRIMPLLFSTLQSEVSRAAQNVGRLYAANTVGCCLGAITLGYLLFLVFEAATVFKIGILLASTCTVLTAFLPGAAVARAKGWGLAAVLALTGLLLPAWSPDFMAAGLFRERVYDAGAFQNPSSFMNRLASMRKVPFYRDDPNTNVAVGEMGSVRYLLVNGKSDGSTRASDLIMTKLLGNLPALFGSPSGRAAVIGLGLGTTSYELSRYPHIEHVDTFEIAQGVIDAQPFFDIANKDILHNPKVTIFHQDAFRGLLASEQNFATIVSEPSNPWVSGVDRLYAKEFYALVKKKLLPGGVFAQWMHSYDLSQSTFEMVLRTFSENFASVRVFAIKNDMVLLGSDQEWTEATYQTAETRWDQAKAKEEFSNLEINNLEDLSLLEVFYPPGMVSSYAAENSLFNPKLAFAAAFDFFLGRGFMLDEGSIGGPAARLYQRQRWTDSFLRRSLKKDPQFFAKMISACTSAMENKLEFAYDKLSPACKSRLMLSAGLGMIKPPASSWKANEILRLVISAKNGQDLDTKLSAEELESVIQNYPEAFPRPSAQTLVNVEHRCGQNDGFGCRQKIDELLLQFGYVDEAKDFFRHELAPYENHRSDNLEFLATIARAQTVAGSLSER